MIKMKKSKISLVVYALALTLVMYNCKKDDKFPTEPDKTLVDKIKNITVPTITATAPAAVTTTAATAEASAKATAVNGDMANIAASGTVPASVTAAAAEVKTALPAADIATLAAVTPATVAQISAGGAVPAELKAVMDKVAANPALQAYLPKFTFPTVAGKTVTGRVGATETVEGVESVEAVQVDDQCTASAEATYAAVKVTLDAAKASNDKIANDAYANAIAPYTTAETTCKSTVVTNFTGYRAAIQAQIDKGVKDLDAAKAVLGDLYPVLDALLSVQAIGAFAGLNDLQAASTKACTAEKEAKLANAKAAQDTDLAKSKSNYDTALAAALAAKTDLLKSCHNQGGGN
jgi:hypothetical protein